MTRVTNTAVSPQPFSSMLFTRVIGVRESGICVSSKSVPLSVCLSLCVCLTVCVTFGDPAVHHINHASFAKSVIDMLSVEHHQ